jgi:cell shape-determining protein MreC
MKMTYLLKTKPNGNGKKWLVFLLFIAAIVSLRLLFPNTLSNLIVLSSQPLLKAGQMANINLRGTENEELVKQVEDLRIKLNDRNVLAEENARLRELVERRGDRQSVVAAVLSKPTYTPYDTFIIDVGSDKGIRVNNIVLAGSSTAIGVVTEVFSSQSKVSAYSSPDARHSVFIGPKNIQAEAIGQGNGNFKIVLPEGTEVNQGDSIVFPGITPTVYGVVEKIVKSDQPSFINVLFKMPVNLSELYYVEVIR